MSEFNLILCRLLTFRYLALVWLAARILKFYFFGTHGFELGWPAGTEVTLWMQTCFFIDTVIGWHFLLFGVGVLLDMAVGPIFFREEIAETRKILNAD